MVPIIFTIRHSSRRIVISTVINLYLFCSVEKLVNSEGCFNYKSFCSILEYNISVSLKIINLLRITLAATNDHWNLLRIVSDGLEMWLIIP